MNIINKDNNKNTINTIICAAFCGTGKTYLCNISPDKYIEFECWKYTDGDFPDNYINEIKSMMGKIEYIFISTNPVVLKELHKKGIVVKLVYPDNSLKKEYMIRYCERNSSYDFIGVMYMHWNNWLNELGEQSYCEPIVLKSGEYLENIL
jgi:DNA-binding HxlR family transcriptional regulator